MALLIVRSGPIPNLVKNLPAFRSIHHSVVVVEVNITLMRTLIARTASRRLFASIVFQVQRTKSRTICMAEVAKLSKSDPKDSKASVVKVWRLIFRRSCAINGASFPANKTDCVWSPTGPKIWMAFFVRPWALAKFLT